MPTTKELRAQAKSYGLKDYSKLRKSALIDLITKARQQVRRERIERIVRANKRGRYPTIFGRPNLDDPQRLEKLRRELINFENEITATLRARKYEQAVRENPRLRLPALDRLGARQRLQRLSRRVFAPIHRRGETPAGIIASEGDQILEEIIPRDGEERGRRTITWKIFRGLQEPVVERVMEKVAELQTAFYLRHSYTIQLRHIETGKIILFHPNELGCKRGSTNLLTTQAAARRWLAEKENKRLEGAIHAPNTKWVFVRWVQVEIKAILTNELLLGNGLLPAWLRNKKGLYALDTFNDNLCIFRCIAIYRGARPDRCEEKARELARSFFGPVLVDLTATPKLTFADLKLVEAHFHLGIRVYRPSEDGTWNLIRQPAHYDAIGIEPMTIGIYNEHAFYIKDHTKLGDRYACAHCNQRCTKASNLARHAKICSKGETEVVCKGEKVLRPQSAYEKSFYPKSNASLASIQWLEHEAQARGLHIHHAHCGHGGEREISGAPVDGYEPTTKTVFQFHGCYFHGCPVHCKQDETRKILKKTQQGIKEGVIYVRDILKKTRQQERKIIKAGYNLVVVWECQKPPRLNIPMPAQRTVPYPHLIFYDFEALLDKTNRYKPTLDLTYEVTHTPISVSIGDTLDRQPTHICDADPEALTNNFMLELQRRAAVLRADVEAQFLPDDIALLSKKQQKKIRDWCSQVPVLGFNSGKYDLNLIKQYFVEELADTCKKVCVAAKGTKIMFLATPEFKFLDIINYLGPGTSYDKWIKAYECKQAKSWFPYEWFDSPDKLTYPGLPDYPAWFSRLKNEHLLTLTEWKGCKRDFREKGMTTFADWLRYYNDLDVGPGIEAAQKMKASYTERGIDIFKDAVSLPGVSLQYLLRGTPEGTLYAPGKKAYPHLKAAVTGGPSIVFTRYHEAGVTRIRSHQNRRAKYCKRVVGYDANALYLSTMLQDMPCGQETVIDIDDPVAAAVWVRDAILKGQLFGFVKCTITVPRHLWKTFEEMPPIFMNQEVPEAAVPPEMKDYLNRTGRNTFNTKKLLGLLEADGILLYTPLLRWYLQHGLELQAVYTAIKYRPEKCLAWFVNEVTEARRRGDVDKAKALLAEIAKLIGNSSYGKLIEALERHTNTSYTKDEETVDKALRSAWFDDLTEIGGAYEIKSRKPRVCIYRPYQCGIAVYQLAKLRILEFYYDFLDRFVDRQDFELIQMDTDSLYFALSAPKLEDVVRPELKGEFTECKKDWLSWDTWSGRTPGLFKLEFEGHRAIALCSKCYFVDGEKCKCDKKTCLPGRCPKKGKHSSKGMSARLNSLTWGRYKATLLGSKDLAENRGFRMYNGQMTTYHQEKLGLSAYYDKRRVLPDGIHTEPIEYTLIAEDRA